MKLTQIIATATTAAVLGTAGVSIAGATTDGGSSFRAKPSVSAETSAATAGGESQSARRGQRRRQVIRQALEVAAHTIGIDKADLLKELRGGKTIAEVATAHNVAPQTVIDAIVNAAKDKIEAAKTAGKLTDEQAAKLEQRLPDAVTKLVNNKHGGKGKEGKGKPGVARKLTRDGVKLAAKTIGIEPADLVKELRAGKTIAEVADAHSVAPQTVIDALVQAAKDKIEAAKTASELTAEQASKLEQHAPQRIARFVNEWHPRRPGVGS